MSIKEEMIEKHNGYQIHNKDQENKYQSFKRDLLLYIEDHLKQHGWSNNTAIYINPSSLKKKYRGIQGVVLKGGMFYKEGEQNPMDRFTIETGWLAMDYDMNEFALRIS